MATKKSTGAKVPKSEENKREQSARQNGEIERQQDRVPHIVARAYRLSNNPQSKIRGYASIDIGGHFVVHGLKIYDGGDKGLRVLCPATKGSDGEYYDDFHPVTREAREALNRSVLDAYEQALEYMQRSELTQEQPEDSELEEDEEPAFEQTM